MAYTKTNSNFTTSPGIAPSLQTYYNRTLLQHTRAHAEHLRADGNGRARRPRTPRGEHAPRGFRRRAVMTAWQRRPSLSDASAAGGAA